MSWISLTFTRLVLFVALLPSGVVASQQSEKQSVIVFTYAMPGLINDVNKQAVGPAVDTISMFFDSLDIQTEFVIQPFARVAESTKKNVNGCSFPVDWTQQRSKELAYVLPLANVQPTLYSLNAQASQPLSFDGQYVVTLINFASQYKLDNLDVSKILVGHPAQAFSMLLNGRVDLLFMDKPMADAIMTSTGKVLNELRAFEPSSTWLVCNKDIALPDKSVMQQHFLRLLQQGELETRWRDAGVHNLYLAFFGQEGDKWMRLLESSAYTSENIEQP